jgi:hypothetical protein
MELIKLSFCASGGHQRRVPPQVVYADEITSPLLPQTREAAMYPRRLGEHTYA